METWQIALFSVALPALITTLIPQLSKWGKARHLRRISDADVAAGLRDELREDREKMRVRVEQLEEERDALTVRVRSLEAEISTLQRQVLRLEGAIRARGLDDILEEMG